MELIKDIARFLAFVAKTGDCWIWNGMRNVRTGRAYFKLRDRNVIAARWLYQSIVSPISKGVCVLHVCDNPACVNPAHLWEGTQIDNIRDRDSKGRNRLTQTHCKNGHLLSGDNVHFAGPNNRWRDCKACRREATRKFRAKRKQLEAEQWQ
jgi:hypothetical protein